jgi:hypothetical protein
LIALANASGTRVDAFLAPMIAKKEQEQSRKLTPQECVPHLKSPADSALASRTTPLPNEALSRESPNPNRT